MSWFQKFHQSSEISTVYAWWNDYKQITLQNYRLNFGIQKLMHIWSFFFFISCYFIFSLMNSLSSILTYTRAFIRAKFWNVCALLPEDESLVKIFPPGIIRIYLFYLSPKTYKFTICTCATSAPSVWLESDDDSEWTFYFESNQPLPAKLRWSNLIASLLRCIFFM